MSADEQPSEIVEDCAMCGGELEGRWRHICSICYDPYCIDCGIVVPTWLRAGMEEIPGWEDDDDEVDTDLICMDSQTNEPLFVCIFCKLGVDHAMRDRLRCSVW